MEQSKLYISIVNVTAPKVVYSFTSFLSFLTSWNLEVAYSVFYCEIWYFDVYLQKLFPSCNLIKRAVSKIHHMWLPSVIAAVQV